MRTTMVTAALAVIFAAGCVPLRVSDARRQQIDDCLKRCPAVGGERVSPALRENQWVDTRSTCERRCHDVSTGEEPASTAQKDDGRPPYLPSTP